MALVLAMEKPTIELYTLYYLQYEIQVSMSEGDVPCFIVGCATGVWALA